MNYKMIVSYDGTRYYGWEHQPGTDMTIQGKLENVLRQMLLAERPEAALTVEKPVLQAGGSSTKEESGGKSARRETGAGESISEKTAKINRSEKTTTHQAAHSQVSVIGAGRTDAGVHARAMTCNVILDTTRSEEEIQQYLNRYLPEDISVNDVKIAADRFHSRYKAIAKTYRYTLWYAADGSKPVFDRRFTYVLERQPDVDRMREAAQYLIGEMDYKSFCGNSHMKKPTIRRIDSIRIEESGHYIRIYYHGSGFLQYQVRIMTGTLLEIGFGKRKPEEMKDILAAKNRQAAGFTAPPQGLCLMKVDY